MKTKYNFQNITFVSWRLSYQIRSAFKQIWLSIDFKDANFHMKEYIARNSVIFYWKLHLQNEMATIILIMIIAATHILNYVGDFVKCTSWIISFNPSVLSSSVQNLLELYVVQLLSPMWLFETPWTAAQQASLSIISLTLLKLMSIESVMSSNHLILYRPLLLPSSIFPSMRVFSNESVLPIKWPKYWNFSFSISPSNGYSGLNSFRMDWFALLVVFCSVMSDS